jgi:hypothetical protein
MWRAPETQKPPAGALCGRGEEKKEEKEEKMFCFVLSVKLDLIIQDIIEFPC